MLLWLVLDDYITPQEPGKLMLPAKLQITFSWTEIGQSRWVLHIQHELLTMVPEQVEGMF